MKKIAYISPKGIPSLVVYYDEKAQRNPYRVYQEWNELTQYGIRERRKQIDRYADLNSCGAIIAEYAARHNEEGR